MQAVIVLGTMGFFAITIWLSVEEFQLLKKSWWALVLYLVPLKAFHFGVIGLRLLLFLRSRFTSAVRLVQIDVLGGFGT